MKKALIFMAACTLLAGPAFAQDRHDDGHDDHPGAPPQHQDAAHPGGPAAQHTAPAAPAAPAAAANAMRHDDHRSNPAIQGPAMQNNAVRAHNGGNNNNGRASFNSYHRNFTAPQRYHAPAYRRPPGFYTHRWTYGERLPAAFWTRNYWLDDFLDYGLIDPPYGTVWVRYGSDALLIDESTGEVIQVEYGVFY